MTEHGETKVDEILEAINRHMTADGDVGMVTGYVLVAKWVTGDGENKLWIETLRRQANSDSLGLFHTGLLHVERMVLYDDEDED